MFHEAIQQVSEAEAAAKALIQEATEAAQKALAEAEATGFEKVRVAVAKGESECADMMQEAEEQAVHEVTELASNTENKKAALGARAEAARSRAVDFIVGRIVDDVDR